MIPVRNKPWYPWLVVALLWGVALLNYMDRQMLSTMKNAMMGDIHELEKAENFGRLMAVFLWIYGLASPVAGLIADRINRKLLIVFSLCMWSVVTLLMGFAADFRQLSILRSLLGVSTALYIPAGLALIADYHQGNTRSLAIGIHMSGLYAGQALGGFGASAAVTWSWQTAFQSIGVIGVIYSLLLIFLLREKRPETSGDTERSTLIHGIRSLKNTFLVLTGSLSFWVLLLYFAIPSFPGWAVKNWLPTLVSGSLDLEMSRAGPLSTIVLAGSSLLGVLTGGIIADRWVVRNVRGRIFTSASGLLFTIPALLLLGFGSGHAAAISGGILFGLGLGMFDANNMPVLCQIASPRHRAAGYGIMNMTGVFAGAFITQWLGKSADAGWLGRDLALLAIPVAVAVILLLATLKPKVADKIRD